MKRIILSEEKLRKILYEASQGTFVPTIQIAQDRFNKLNNELFSNELAMPRFVFTNNSRRLGEFQTQIDTTNRNLVNPIIEISTYYQYNDNQFDSLMAHEMIHYKIAKNGGDGRKHNNKWCQLASDINKNKGLNITATIDTSGYVVNQNKSNVASISQQTASVLKSISEYLNKLYSYAVEEHKKLSETSKNQPSMISASLNLVNLCTAIPNGINRCLKRNNLYEETSQPSWKDVLGIQGGLRSYANNFMNNYKKWNNKLWLHKKTVYTYTDSKGNVKKTYSTLYELLFNVYPKVKDEYSKYSSTLSYQSPTLPKIISEIDSLQQIVQNEISNNQQQSQPSQQQGNSQPQP